MDDSNMKERPLDERNQDNVRKPTLYSKEPPMPLENSKIRTSAWLTLAVLGCTLLVTFYGETMLLPAIRDIITDFHISYSTSSWILTAYLISGAVATPIAGKLSDIYGRKKMVLVIFVI